MNKYKITSLTWNEIADVYASHFMDLEIYNEGYELFTQRLPASSPRVLEIGCGPGNISKHIRSMISDAEIEGIDVAPAMIELAKANNPKGKYYEMDARNIQMIANNYHGIACGFCIPYLSKTDVVKLFLDCRNLLYSDGLFYLSFVDGDYSKSGFQTGSTGQRVYFYYHESEFILNCLINSGFELIENSIVDYSKSDASIEKHCVLIARAI